MSRFLIEKETLFLHIPRTGGTWVEDALRDLNIKQSRWSRQGRWGVPRKHCLLFHYSPNRRFLIKKVFTFVRHPIPFYESIWKYLSVSKRERRGQKWDWGPFGIPAGVYNRNFNAWVLDLLHFYPGWYSNLLDLYIGPEGGEFCNYVGQTRNLRTHLELILRDLGYEDLDYRILDSIPKKNAQSAKVEWTYGLKDKVIQTEYRVLERFFQSDSLLKISWDRVLQRRVELYGIDP